MERIDGGVGVANALAAIRHGAVQVQGTINGYGERVGNCNLTTIMPNLQLKMGIELGLDLTRLRELSNFVDELANVPHDIRAPYVGLDDIEALAAVLRSLPVAA